METNLAQRIARDPNYQKLRSRRNRLGWTLTPDFKEKFLTGSDELALVRSGLDDTMRTAYQSMRAVWHGRNDVQDLRVAAYIVAIDRVSKTYVSKGL